MKNSLCYIAPLFGFITISPLLLAQEPPNPPPKEQREMRVIVNSDDEAPNVHREQRRIMLRGGKHEMETVTFLGVETSPVGPTVSAQLNLPSGSGLVVGHVVPASPAAAVLKMHDVLLKLDDQILISQRQLAVLVRNHKEGDEVTLTYVRGGKEATVKVKLGKHEVPKFAAAEVGAGPLAFAFNGEEGEMPPLGRVEMDRMLSMMDGPGGPGMRRLHVERGEGPGDRTISVTVNTGNSNMVFNDEKGSLELKMADDKKSLVAKGPKGDVLFSGPVNTPEERKALPADLRERLEKLESMHEFSFKTDDDFKPGAVNNVRPPGTKIRFLLPAEPDRLPPPAF